MEIHNWKTGKEGTNLIGTFTVYIPAIGLSLHRVKCLRSKKGHPFIAFPNYLEDPQAMEKKWLPCFDFSEQRKPDFIKKCLELLQDYISMVEQKKTFAGDLF